MDWLISIVVGVALWAFLPRGVVLVRAVKANQQDTWTIKNDSPLPVRLTSVRVASPETVELEPGKIEEPALPLGGLLGVRLSLDDETSDGIRLEWQRPWDQVVVGPGDTLTACVPVNTSVYIDYRRGGWSGVFERRHLVIHGTI